MKKGLVIFLLLICLFQSGEIFFIYRLHQGITYYQLQREKCSSSLVLTKLILSKADYEKFRLNGREIRINGLMYDIKNLEISSDSVYIIAKRDLLEEQIIAGINCLLEPTHPTDKKQTIALFKLSLLDYLLPQNKIYIQSLMIGNYVFHPIEIKWTNNPVLLTIPPPKQIIEFINKNPISLS